MNEEAKNKRFTYILKMCLPASNSTQIVIGYGQQFDPINELNSNINRIKSIIAFILALNALTTLLYHKTRNKITNNNQLSKFN